MREGIVYQIIGMAIILLVVVFICTCGCSPWKAVDARFEDGKVQPIVTWKNLVNGRTYSCPDEAMHGDIKWIPWESEFLAEQCGFFQENKK